MAIKSDHYIDEQGQNIVCRADIGQPCRKRPKCDTETWGDINCDDHDDTSGPHAVTHSQPCWLIEWTNADSLIESALDYFDPIVPGSPVKLHWEGEHVLWEVVDV